MVADAYRRARAPAESKGRIGDYVSDVDRRSESVIRDVLAERVPGLAVLGEESGGDRGETFWAVDPLDATTNFLIGFPVVSVSVALIRDGEPSIGVVEAPLLGRRFSGARRRGAWCGRERLSVSRRPPERAIVATAFPFRVRHRLSEYSPVFSAVFDRIEDIRRAGSAALDLAWTASGVWDGFFELNLGVWDVAAGSLLVEEAGGVVSGWSGGRDFLSGDVLAGSPQTHAVLAEEAGRDR